jgi:hypothetical protein
MDEQRTQAYINLIEQLLTCTDDEELNNILQANQELIDPDFLGSSLPFMLNQQTRCQDNILLTQKFRKFLKP